MKLNIVQYKTIETDSYLEQYPIQEVDMSKLNSWRDSDAESTEIKTENLDVIKIFRHDNEPIAFCIPKQIQEDLDFCFSAMKEQLKEQRSFIAQLDIELNNIKKMDFWQRLRFLFTRKIN